MLPETVKPIGLPSAAVSSEKVKMQGVEAGLLRWVAESPGAFPPLFLKLWFLGVASSSQEKWPFQFEDS